MKKNYSKSIRLQCPTCGSDYSFETNEKNGVITCKKCNRVYYGGEDELIELNQRRIDDEMQQSIEEVQNDVTNELNKIFKNL